MIIVSPKLCSTTCDSLACCPLDLLKSQSLRRGNKADKIIELLGKEAPRHYIDTVNADSKPWYLRPTYSQTEIVIDADGTVKGGTVPALVERLTAHEHGGKRTTFPR
jgi:son of sevenless-like protein